MYSEKKESEGIALLSIYGDEDDDVEDIEGSEGAKRAAAEEDALREDVIIEDSVVVDADDGVVGIHSARGNTPLPPLDDSTPKPSPSSPLLMPQQIVAFGSSRGRKGTLTIVEYGHDEGALSPEAEEGEIVATGHVTMGAEPQINNGTPPGIVQILTPGTQATPPHRSEQQDPSQDAMTNGETELKSAEHEQAVKTSEDEQNDMDPMGTFLPSPPKAKCSDELQEKIKKFILLKKKTGRSFNSKVRNRKDYRNPDFLRHAVTYQEIDEIGSCFSREVFDPHGYDKSDFFDEIEADMKRELERRVQENKKSQKVEFLSGGTQPGTIIPSPNITMHIPAVPSAAGGSLHSVPAVVDAVARDGRQNKKSKWDKVDVDKRFPLTAGPQDSVSGVSVHAALLSAANAGTGYTAFAQQKRREVEERRSGDKRLDRRS